MVVSHRNGWGEMSVRWVLRPGLRRKCVKETSGGKRMEGDGAATGRGRGGESQEGEKKRGDGGRGRPGRETKRERTQVREIVSPGSGMGGMMRYAPG